MSKEVMEAQVNNTICEAVGCFEKAATKINVKVGERGSISLDLCSSCIHKFDQKGRMLESVVQTLSNTNRIIQSSSSGGTFEND
jgi:hypothetical protein